MTPLGLLTGLKDGELTFGSADNPLLQFGLLGQLFGGGGEEEEVVETPPVEEEEEQAGIDGANSLYHRVGLNEQGGYDPTPEGMVRVPGTGHTLNRAGLGAALMSLGGGW